MKMNRSRLLIAVLALGGITSAFATGPNFHPDTTVSAKSLGGWHTLGDAQWRAENGEIVGTPGANGGWLVFDKSYQDILFYTQFRCSDGCASGLLMRMEKTADGGMKGVFVPMGSPTNNMDAGGTYDVVLDAQGKIVSATAEPRGSSFDRIISPWPPKAAAAPAAPPVPRAPGGAGFARGPAVPMPFTRVDSRYKPNDWNTIEMHVDANIVRGGVNGGGGRITETAEGYGPIALYVGGTGKVEFKDIALSDLGLQTREPEKTSTDFRKQTISDFYYGWGQAVADVNHDGHLDIISGPYVYYGPDFTKFREIFRGEASNPTVDFASEAHEEFAADFTGDGWPDLLTARFSCNPCGYLYVNPKGENHTWEKHAVIDNITSELTTVGDIEGPGKPALVYAGEGYTRYAEPDPANPTAKWIIHNVSERGYGASHGIGVGDINGDGRLDILNPYGWWENPGPGNGDKPWKYHPVDFGHNGSGGAIMEVFDVNGDGLPDVVTSLNAHGWGLAWFEQKRDAQGNISFVRHMVMDDFSTKNAGDVAFSELHGSGVGDVNGDGIPDFITGKRWYSHLDSGIDPDTMGSPVLYWYETVRDPKAEGGARLVPHLIDNRSGIGNTVAAVDLNHSGSVDIVTTTRFGTAIFWNKMHPKKAAAAKAGATAKTTTTAKRRR
jgi:hypothetical protein